MKAAISRPRQNRLLDLIAFALGAWIPVLVVLRMAGVL